MMCNPAEHRRRSIRLRGYDYSQAGAYFVTICTQNRECLFGTIADGKMVLNPLGEIAAVCWNAIPVHFRDVELDEYVVMPNHIHGIIVILDRADYRRGTACRAPTMERFGRPLSGSLATIVRSFKSAATKRINEWRCTPGAVVWQRNYYEHIIRNEREWDAIREYIYLNPTQWDQDIENPERKT
ncbi:MAG: transposase [Chloroflexi bacterium]|nr:transposase [Chloroflexota bacterium]